MSDIETSGKFYLGKQVDPATGKLESRPFFYDSKNFTTHAVCIGMTGSGKTGLGIALLEEAALNSIPAIIIDPKGDLGNLFLTFPNLSRDEFKPWIDLGEAEKRGMEPNEYAEYISKIWKEGLASWGEDIDRVRKFKSSAEINIYTPGHNAGRSISVLNSFLAPNKNQEASLDNYRERVLTLTSSIMGLLDINADPIQSREYTLISAIIDYAWQKGQNLDIETLIQLILKPSFSSIGALDINTFFPEKDRKTLSIMLNNLIASPSFKVWMQGEPLDIQKFYSNNHGKPRLSIFSIAHLSDSERMFFVSLLLNEILAWLRSQPGTSSLRAMLYMDEIFGYFPPTAMPPSKLPMLSLLKQARAYGLGIVLVTQNPVDLDYKGLGNCGTWFIGKLQTERDKARVLDGLRLASNGETDTLALNRMISMTGNRTFILRSIYEKEPLLFQTRWTLSYLRGPLTLSQIATLTQRSSSIAEKALNMPETDQQNDKGIKPIVLSGISEFFVHMDNNQEPLHYKPNVAGFVKLHFVDTKLQIDFWEEIAIIAFFDDSEKRVVWEQGLYRPELKNQMDSTPISGSTFEYLPAMLMQEKSYALFAKSLASFLYQFRTFTLYQVNDYNIVSKQGETEADFRKRVLIEVEQKIDQQIKKLQEKYASKSTSLMDKIKRAENKFQQKAQKKGIGIFQTGLAFLSAILDGIFGRKVTKDTISKTGTTLRRASQIGKNSQEVDQAEQELKDYQQQLKNLEEERNVEVEAMQSVKYKELPIEKLVIRPKKSDILVERVVLIWVP